MQRNSCKHRHNVMNYLLNTIFSYDKTSKNFSIGDKNANKVFDFFPTSSYSLLSYVIIKNLIFLLQWDQLNSNKL